MTDFSRVNAYVSDLRSVSRNISMQLSPILFNVNYRWSLNYTLQSVKDYARGFNGNTAGDPFTKEWGPDSPRLSVSVEGTTVSGSVRTRL